MSEKASTTDFWMFGPGMNAKTTGYQRIYEISEPWNRRKLEPRKPKPEGERRTEEDEAQ